MFSSFWIGVGSAARQMRGKSCRFFITILLKILMAVMDWNMAHTHRFYYATTACRCQKVPRQAALLFQPTHYKPLSPIGKAGNSNASHKRSEWLYQCRFAPVSIDPRNTTNRS